MRSFEKIHAIALERKSNLRDLLSTMDAPKSREELISISDDRWLSGMTRCVFNAGFNWYVINKMWPDFEGVFGGFEVGRCSMLSDEDIGELVSDKRIVRSGRKIRAVRENAIFLRELRTQYGSVGMFFAEWPKEDYVGLLKQLKKRGSRLGGNTGRFFLRRMGMDSFILSRDVTKRLIAEGVIEKMPTSQKDLTTVQDAFNLWKKQSGLTITEVSRILDFSVG
ncbi:3-methyladenine DNA glycosylase [Alphaproteobacteria bacterium 46_93_T64]|nr:3-methyladenine DNA glycosylase [Alphaproteobacteria bacterium 46_93_T64]